MYESPDKHAVAAALSCEPASLPQYGGNQLYKVIQVLRHDIEFV